MSKNFFVHPNGAVERINDTSGPGPGSAIHFNREGMMPETPWLNEEEVFKNLQDLPRPPDIDRPEDDDL